jgi:signal transduction histidine kinase
MSTSEPIGGAPSVAQLEAECRRLREALALAERDRQLLGYEIHDDVVQNLTAAALLLEGAARQAAFASAELAETYASGMRLLRDAITKARALIHGVVGMETKDGDLDSSLSRLAEWFRTELELPVVFESGWGQVELPLWVQHLLQRIAQEALFNAWKHAHASRVEVRLATEDDKLTLIVQDDGVGFDPANTAGGHLGLNSIRHRAAVLGAELLIDTAPQHGTRIIVRLTPP